MSEEHWNDTLGLTNVNTFGRVLIALRITVWKERKLRFDGEHRDEAQELLYCSASATTASQPIVIEKGAMDGAMPFTTILAIYAAIASSIALGWQLYRELQERAGVKVSVSLMRLVAGGDERRVAVAPDLATNNGMDINIVLTITNVGRNPVLLNRWDGEWKIPERGKDKFFVISQGLPMTLKGRESHQEFTPDLSVVSPHIKALFVRNSTGKNWYVPDKELQKAVEQAGKLVSDPEGVPKDHG